eukprot:2267390-Prorocentrum_lima.AAC.1
MTSSLVGSEMCIRDRVLEVDVVVMSVVSHISFPAIPQRKCRLNVRMPVSYTHLTLPTICSV